MRNPERHTLLVKRQTQSGTEESEKISENDYAGAVKKDLSAKLVHVPVKNNPTLTKEGAVRINFQSKENMDDATKALSQEYTVTQDTRVVELLDPKLIMFDLKGEFETGEDLKQKILDKNTSIKELVDEGEIFKVIFIESANMNKTAT